MLASFSAGGVYARADILDPAPNDAWDADGGVAAREYARVMFGGDARDCERRPAAA